MFHFNAICLLWITCKLSLIKILANVASVIYFGTAMFPWNMFPFGACALKFWFFFKFRFILPICSYGSWSNFTARKESNWCIQKLLISFAILILWWKFVLVDLGWNSKTTCSLRSKISCFLIDHLDSNPMKPLVLIIWISQTLWICVFLCIINAKSRFFFFFFILYGLLMFWFWVSMDILYLFWCELYDLERIIIQI